MITIPWHYRPFVRNKMRINTLIGLFLKAELNCLAYIVIAKN